MQDIIRGFLTNELMVPDKIENTTLLFDEGFIDSNAMVELLTFLEKEFSLQITPFDVSLDNFGSISRIENFLKKKLNTE